MTWAEITAVMLLWIAIMVTMAAVEKLIAWIRTWRTKR